MRWWVLSREAATERVRRHVEGAGLPWTEPVSVSRRPLGGWQVMTNAEKVGGNVFVSISRRGRITGGDAVTRR